MNSADRKTQIAAQFHSRFGGMPSLWARAPGRVDLMGSHTDYNLGYVMTMTVDRDTWIAARPRHDRHVVVESMNRAGRGEIDLDHIDPNRAAPWVDYIAGVAHVLQQAGYVLRGFDGLVHSTVPFGSGLSSSAALEMAAAVLFQAVSGFRLDPVQMALLGQAAENRFVGVNCGILDQYSSALGAAGCALLLDCRDLTHRAVPIAGDLCVVIGDTRAERHLAGTEYGERRAQCEEGVRRLQSHLPGLRSLRELSAETLAAHERLLPPLVASRCRFIVEENARVLALAEALPAGDRPQLAELFAASYRGAVELYEIGAPAMEAMRRAMLAAPGVIAARQAGAGFGGCLVALVDAGGVDRFIASAAAAYAAAAGIEPQLFAVQAADGAGMLAQLAA